MSTPHKNVSPLWGPFNHRCAEDLVEILTDNNTFPDPAECRVAFAAAIPTLVR
jgi:hypothetical protein